MDDYDAPEHAPTTETELSGVTSHDPFERVLRAWLGLGIGLFLAIFVGNELRVGGVAVVAVVACLLNLVVVLPIIIIWGARRERRRPK